MGVGLLALIVGILYVPGFPSNAAVGRWGAILIGSAIILIARWRVPIRPGRAHVLGACLLGYMLLGFSWTVSEWDSLGAFIQWVALAAAFCVGYQEPDLERFWRGIGIGVSFSAPFAIAQALGYLPVWSITNGVNNPLGMPGYLGGNYGLFLTQNMAGEAAVLGIVAAMASREKVLLVGPAVLAYLAGGRAPVLALTAAGAAWLWKEKPEYRAIQFFAWVQVAIVAWVSWMADLAPHAFRLGDRLEIWSLFLRNTNLWGDGLNSVAIAAPGIGYAHNEVVHYGFELGVGSLLLWAIVLHALRGRDAFAVAAVAAILALALVWFPLHDPLPAFALAILAGYLSADRDRALRFERTRRMVGSEGVRYLHPPLAR